MEEPSIDPVLAGDVVSNRYRVIDKLGEGGMGVLYRACETEAANRTVVLKFPKKEILYRKGFAARFKLEIQSLVGFDHPHVVQVFGVGEHNHCPYMVLKYLVGGSLDKRIATTGPLSPSELMRWLPDIASALDTLHRDGIIHRDVKAGNILFDSHGETYLSDFGIVKVLGEIGGTAPGSALGSAESLAPEYIKDEPITGAYDQYGLATAVYQALSGRLPLEARNTLELQVVIITQAPHDLLDYAPNVGSAFSSVVMRALSKDPAQRFSSCAAFVIALERALQDKSSNVSGEPKSAPSSHEVSLEIRCNVEGTIVTIDGIAKGSAPLKWRLAVGPHNLCVEKRGYLPFDKTIDLREDRSIKVDLQRKRRPKWLYIGIGSSAVVIACAVELYAYLHQPSRDSLPPARTAATVVPPPHASVDVVPPRPAAGNASMARSAETSTGVVTTFAGRPGVVKDIKRPQFDEDLNGRCFTYTASSDEPTGSPNKANFHAKILNKCNNVALQVTLFDIGRSEDTGQQFFLNPGEAIDINLTGISAGNALFVACRANDDLVAADGISSVNAALINRERQFLCRLPLR